MEAGLRQFGCDDAPDEPDRKTEMLGENRPYEITPRDEFAFGFPKLLILWVPVRNPRWVSLAHHVFLSGWARFSRSAGSHRSCLGKTCASFIPLKSLLFRRTARPKIAHFCGAAARICAMQNFSPGSDQNIGAV